MVTMTSQLSRPGAVWIFQDENLWVTSADRQLYKRDASSEPEKQHCGGEGGKKGN